MSDRALPRSKPVQTDAQISTILTTARTMSNHNSHRLAQGRTKLLLQFEEDEISSEYLSVRDTKRKQPLIPTTITIIMRDENDENDDDDDNAVPGSHHHHHHHDDATLTKPYPKCVRFDQVEVREYPMELGSSIPTCGAPVGIAWSSVSQCFMTVDDYETQHPHHQQSCGSTRVLPSQQRLDV
jgi:hypothetical protein